MRATAWVAGDTRNSPDDDTVAAAPEPSAVYRRPLWLLLSFLLPLFLPFFLGALLRRLLLVFLRVVRFGHFGYLEVNGGPLTGILFHLRLPEQELLLALAGSDVLTSRAK